jgi:oxygen-independent coproporphyrinogen-3 oxidase
MSASLYSRNGLERSRKHFINSYPPFNVAKAADDSCLGATRELALYVHIPFCPTICTYCFYKKFGRPSESEVDTYLRYLKREIELYADRSDAAERKIKTLYIGGGTPSVLSVPQLVDLLSTLRAHLDLDRVEEFCCEIMPHATTATADKLAALRDLGVSRLSFGVESFDESLLKLHNRPCTRELYDWTYSTACDLGFPTINIDMMSGLAGATWDTWRGDVENLLRWSPPSVSIYKTEVFYNTTMFTGMRHGKGMADLISDAEEIEHIRYAHETLQARGNYLVGDCLHLVKEISDCDLHYRSIWNGTELKGLGLSAHSSCDGVLHQNASELVDYYALLDAGRLPVKRAHQLSARDRLSQAMVYGLKNLAVSRAGFVQQFGVDMTALYGPVIDDLVSAGVMTLDDEWLRITPENYIFTDDVCRQFFLPEYEQMMLAHLDRSTTVSELTVYRPN